MLFPRPLPGLPEGRRGQHRCNEEDDGGERGKVEDVSGRSNERCEAGRCKSTDRGSRKRTRIRRMRG